MFAPVFKALSLLILAQFAVAGGLQIGVLKSIPESECTVKSKAGDLISVHYEGTLEDGTVFDSSFKRNSPITFQLGTGRVIKGWDQGLLDMCIGEKRKLTIPSELAYGDSGIGPIPPKATLVFVTELVSIDGGHDEL
ncbi:Peptidyl-prolyl cis-trans isomerase fpr2 [Meyerozyma guilliermondii]